VRPPRDPATIGVYKQPIGFRPPSAIFVPTVRAVRLPDGSILIGYFID